MVRYGDEADAFFGEIPFQIPPALDIIPAEAGQVLDDDAGDFPLLDIGKHPHKSRPMKGKTRISVVNVHII